MTRRTQLLVAAVLVGVTTAPALAQDLQAPRPRQGYFVALGAHGALTHNRDDGEGLGLSGGGTSTLRLGQLLTRRIGVGLLIDAGATSGAHQLATIVGVGVEGQVEVAAGLAVRAGVGLGVVSLDDTSREDEPLRGVYGAAYTVGLTYDWFLSRPRSGGWALTPGLQVRYLPGDTFDSFGAFLGVEVSYWSGLPRSQLVLPDAEAYRKGL